jgi:hypothetical protein
VVEREFERVAHIVADHGHRTAERRDESDLDRFLLGHGRPGGEQQSGARGQQNFTHR